MVVGMHALTKGESFEHGLGICALTRGGTWVGCSLGMHALTTGESFEHDLGICALTRDGPWVMDWL